MKSLIAVFAVVAMITAGVAIYLDKNPDLLKTLNQTVDNLKKPSNSAGQGGLPSDEQSLVNPQFAGSVRSERVQFAGVPYPMDTILSDLNGRKIQVEVMGRGADFVQVIRLDTQDNFRIPLEDLSQKDAARLSELPLLSASQTSYLMNKKQQANEILEQLSALKLRQQAIMKDAGDDATTASRTISDQIDRLEKRFLDIEASVQPILNSL